MASLGSIAGVHLDLDPGATAWRAAMELYYEDKVEGAFEIAGPSAGAYHGSLLRTYRLIEGEARTRRASRRYRLASWLEFEWVPEEVPDHAAAGQAVLEAASAVSTRLKWDRHESTLATVLVAEADADWNDSRYGYCVDKVPYDKICLPQVVCADPAELSRVAAHEFAHVVVLNMGQKLAPHWLDEGIACLMEGRVVARAAKQTVQRGQWLSPLQMGGAFEVDRRDPANLEGVGAAYDQATVLVGYLHSLAADQGLVDLLTALPDHSRWMDVLMTLVKGKPVDAALHHVYGFDEGGLFAKAAGWIGAT
ncbi:MAG: hypothetical protein HYR64_06800 [Fimbriimonas ginsengisoli]|uniref:Peptidase MA-like domain-containing protein n=1 Tax=Fimbriimonas ginsengisoli TaxID=1005039 RepID=A0A931LV96_FIMGI|nr:hypothetical protein [Fimbriimonas ginsengisoli]